MQSFLNASLGCICGDSAAGKSKMLERFQARLGSVRRLPRAARSPTVLARWTELLSNMDDGTVDYDTAEKTMRTELRKHSVKPDDSMQMAEFFRSVVEDLRVLAVRDKTMRPLRAWTDGKMSVHETLLAVQKLVNEGAVDPNWLIDPDNF